MDKFIESNQPEKALRLLKRTVQFNLTEYENIKKLVRCFGCEAYQSDFEADKLLAFLAKNNLNSMVLSNDSDCLALGVPKLLRIFSHKKEGVELVLLNEILEKWNLSMENFVEFCVMMGTDYNRNIRGVGPETLFRIIENLKDNESVFEKFKLKNEFEQEVYFREIKEYFMDQDSGDFAKFDEQKVENTSELEALFEEHAPNHNAKRKEWILRNLSDVLEIRSKNEQ